MEGQEKVGLRKKNRLIPIAAAFLVGIINTCFATAAVANGFPPQYLSGIDVSYPNCAQQLPVAEFAIVGVNGGTAYSYNSCLQSEARQLGASSYYLNTGLNDDSASPYYSAALKVCHSNTSCAAYIYGYRSAVASLVYAQLHGVGYGSWWLDVETGNSWSSNTRLNQKSLQGEHDALLDNGMQFSGVYSTMRQWTEITGGWHNGWPSWYASAQPSAEQAKHYCHGYSFSGGPTLLVQFQSPDSLVDQDITCS